MQEIMQLKDKHPKDVSSYFGELQDQHYPHISAASMVQHLAAATPHAQEHLGRPPVKLEAAYLAHSKEPPANYYARTASQQGKIPDSTNVLSLENRRDVGGRSSRDSRGQASDQRTASD